MNIVRMNIVTLKIVTYRAVSRIVAYQKIVKVSKTSIYRILRSRPGKDCGTKGNRLPTGALGAALYLRRDIKERSNHRRAAFNETYWGASTEWCISNKFLTKVISTRFSFFLPNLITCK